MALTSWLFFFNGMSLILCFFSCLFICSWSMKYVSDGGWFSQCPPRWCCFDHQVKVLPDFTNVTPSPLQLIRSQWGNTLRSCTYPAPPQNRDSTHWAICPIQSTSIAKCWFPNSGSIRRRSHLFSLSVCLYIYQYWFTMPTFPMTCVALLYLIILLLILSQIWLVRTSRSLFSSLFCFGSSGVWTRGPQALPFKPCSQPCWF
jgi:hypothetical protein